MQQTKMFFGAQKWEPKKLEAIALLHRVDFDINFNYRTNISTFISIYVITVVYWSHKFKLTRLSC